MKKLLIASAGITVLLVVGLFCAKDQANAQSGSRSSKQPYHNRLWTWLERQDYKRWSRPPGHDEDFQPGQSPHGALVKTYLSRTAARNTDRLAYGSVVVKENYSPDKKLMAVTVMQRAKGYDPKNGDWYYAKFMPNGQIAKAPPEMKRMPIAGKVKTCIECHSGADGGDFAFFND